MGLLTTSIPPSAVSLDNLIMSNANFLTADQPRRRGKETTCSSATSERVHLKMNTRELLGLSVCLPVCLYQRIGTCSRGATIHLGFAAAGDLCRLFYDFNSVQRPFYQFQSMRVPLRPGDGERPSIHLSGDTFNYPSCSN